MIDIVYGNVFVEVLKSCLGRFVYQILKRASLLRCPLVDAVCAYIHMLAITGKNEIPELLCAQTPMQRTGGVDGKKVRDMDSTGFIKEAVIAVCLCS